MRGLSKKKKEKKEKKEEIEEGKKAGEKRKRGLNRARGGPCPFSRINGRSIGRFASCPSAIPRVLSSLQLSDTLATHGAEARKQNLALVRDYTRPDRICNTTRVTICSLNNRLVKPRGRKLFYRGVETGRWRREEREGTLAERESVERTETKASNQRE